MLVRGPKLKKFVVTLYFVMLGIKPYNNFIVRHVLHKKSVNGMIFILPSFSE